MRCFVASEFVPTCLRSIGIVIVLMAVLLLILPWSVTAKSFFASQSPYYAQLDDELYIIVVAEAINESIAQGMAVVIQEVLQRPLHLYRHSSNKVMIILTGHPLPLADAEVIAEDIRGLDLFEATSYPSFYPVKSSDYCDQTGRCLAIWHPGSLPREDI